MTVANLRYQSSKGKAFGKVRDLGRYFQYRQDRDQHIPQERGMERWVNHGLGNNFREIAENCEVFKSDHVQAFFLVINPNPDLVDMIPEEQRETFTKELTEATVEVFFTERGIDTPEYSYAFHLRETRDKDIPGRDNPHTHVILPGTYESWADGERLPLYMNRNKRENHIDLLHQVSQQQMAHLLNRYVGLDWEQRYDTLMQERNRTEEIPVPIPFTMPDDFDWLSHKPDIPPHFQKTDQDGSPTQVWLASHPDLFTDRHHLGFIFRWEYEGKMVQEFNPGISDLSMEEMKELSNYLLGVLQRDNGIEMAERFMSHVGSMSEEERADMFAKAAAERKPAEPEIDGSSFEMDM